MTTPIYIELDDQLNQRVRKKARDDVRSIKATIELLIRKGLKE